MNYGQRKEVENKATLVINMKPHTKLYLIEFRNIFVRKLLATCTSFSEGIL